MMESRIFPSVLVMIMGLKLEGSFSGPPLWIRPAIPYLDKGHLKCGHISWNISVRNLNRRGHFLYIK